jgi:N-succinyldiaminopimelate aminotransferase
VTSRHPHVAGSQCPPHRLKISRATEHLVTPAHLREFGTTIFSEMTALALRTGALNLGQGFPDSDGPPALLEAVQRAIANGANQYQPLPGRPELRAAIARQRCDDYGISYDLETEILVTYGATEPTSSQPSGR